MLSQDGIPVWFLNNGIKPHLLSDIASAQQRHRLNPEPFSDAPRHRSGCSCGGRRYHPGLLNRETVVGP